MKIAPKILSLLVIGLITIFYAGCNKNDDKKKTEEETQLGKLKSSWNIVSANDGDDRTADFTGLILTVSGNFVQDGTYQYSLTGTRPNPSPWPASGTWKFGTNKSSQIIRDPGTASEIPMTYVVSDSELTLSFEVPEGSEGWTGSGRIQSVTGQWTFTFSK